MPFKAVTGNPGAGKSYYIMREVICKRFKWDDEFHEWKRKDKDPFTIVTNMAGLKLPHINFAQHLKENDITFREFFTTSYIEKLTDEIGPIIILIDEAQKYFPKTFKDKKEVELKQDSENSCFYFFEYHRHYPVEIYLAGQRWTRMHPDIVGLADCQIHAVNRVFKLGNEFRYNFMNGFEKIGGTILRSDPKVFALYKSFEMEEEVKGKSVNPIRKVALLCVLGVLALVVAMKMFFSSFGPQEEARVEPTPTKVGRSVEIEAPAATPPGQPGRVDPEPGAEKLTVILDDDPRSSRVRLGGMWLEDKLIAVDLFGNVLSVRDFPFPYTHNREQGSVYAMLPDAYLAKIKRDIDTAHEWKQNQEQRVAQVHRSYQEELDIEEYAAKRARRAALRNYSRNQGEQP